MTYKGQDIKVGSSVMVEVPATVVAVAADGSVAVALPSHPAATYTLTADKAAVLTKAEVTEPAKEEQPATP